MMYHLCKQSRFYHGEPYCGATSAFLPASFVTLDEARMAVKLFLKRNPVGWDIYDSTTRKRVE